MFVKDHFDEIYSLPIKVHLKSRESTYPHISRDVIMS